MWWEESPLTETCSPSYLQLPGGILAFSLFPILASTKPLSPHDFTFPLALASTGLELSFTSLHQPPRCSCSRPPGMSFYCPSLYGLLTHLPAPTPAPASIPHTMPVRSFMSNYTRMSLKCSCDIPSHRIKPNPPLMACKPHPVSPSFLSNFISHCVPLPHLILTTLASGPFPEYMKGTQLQVAVPSNHRREFLKPKSKPQASRVPSLSD